MNSARTISLLLSLCFVLVEAATIFAQPSTTPAVPSAVPSVPPVTPTLTAADLETLLNDSERFLRPLPNEQLLILIHELEARGLTQAARELRGRLKTDELVRLLLQINQPAPALELIHQWQKDDPEDNKARILEAVALYAQGSTELAERTISLAQARATGTEVPFLRLLSELVSYQATHGKPVSAEGNPWNVSFISDSGHFEAGKIAEKEKAKIPPGTIKALAELATLLPTSAPTWALLGEFLNAEGSVPAATTCFERARALGYTPRILLEHARILGDYEKSRREQLNKSIGGGATAPAATPPTTVKGWESLATRPQEFIVIIVGGMVILLILLLQIRQWLRPKRR